MDANQSANQSMLYFEHQFSISDATKTAIVERNIIHNPLVKALICTLYVVIVICGICGNGLVVFVVGRSKAMRTAINIFIASLAVNDIVICTFTVPLTPLYTFLEGWHFGSFPCHLFPLIQAASLYISTLTLTAIAVMRFYVICVPNNCSGKGTMRVVLLTIAGIWLLSFAVCLPYAIYIDYVAPGNGHGARCVERWPHPAAQRIFGTVSLAVQYCIPLIIITSCYAAISIRLRSAAKNGTQCSIETMLVLQNQQPVSIWTLEMAWN